MLQPLMLVRSEGRHWLCGIRPLASTTRGFSCQRPRQEKAVHCAPDAAFWPLSFAHHPFGVVSNALQPVKTAYISMPGLAHTKYTVLIQKRPFASGAPCTDRSLERHLMGT